MSNENIISKLEILENRLNIIDNLVISQDEKIKEQSRILETLYKELHGKEKKIQDLERSKTKGCGDDK